MIRVNQAGSFDKSEKLLRKASKGISEGRMRSILEYYGQFLVDLLSSDTPVDTGETADSWSYKVSVRPNDARLYFHNSHVEDGVNIAIILQYGHATRNGGYVYGIDYMSEPYQKIFQLAANEIWKEVGGL